MNRRDNNVLREKVAIPYDHASQTADLEVKLMKFDRPFIVDRVHYVNPTGLAADAANYFALQVRKNATAVCAKWSTQTGQEGALTADAFVEFVDGADADRIFAVNDELSFFMDETGTQTLPAGRVVIEGRYL